MMHIQVVLFDLDGTLLPMDQDVFVKYYFGLMAKHLAPYGYESEALIKAIWQGTAEMVKNSGEKTNEAVFWNCFTSLFGENARKDEPHFDAFYREKFDQVSVSCGKNEKAAEVIALCKEKGLRTVLATNPIFPAIATKKRVAWAGLSPSDFELITTYENSHSCKPNPAYYTEILQKIGVEPENCLMVGNDVREDMVAETLGMQVFLLTDCVINKDGVDISRYPNGGFDELTAFIQNL
ncbi:MAG: HAD family hydrolase [Clostridia bacterium]|nr:HAD family hydrolase [Clostridia bacterium]